MLDERSRALLLSLTVVFAISVAVACATKPDAGASTTHYCDCVATSFVVLEIPQAERSDVTAVEVSGPACTGPIEICDPVPGADAGQLVGVGQSECASVTVNAHDDGVCHVAVTFRNRPSFVTDVTFTTPADAPCGAVCARRPIGLDGGALLVSVEPTSDAGASD